VGPYAGTGYNDLYRYILGGSTFASKGEMTLASNETVFAAVSRLSNAMGTLPLKLYKDFQQVHTNSSDLLSSAPNANMTSFDFIRTLESLRNTSGNGYAIKIYGRNYQIESLQILDPKRVTPIFDEVSMELCMKYKVQRMITTTTTYGHFACYIFTGLDFKGFHLLMY
jgi:HK97 family phage portal protein